MAFILLVMTACNMHNHKDEPRSEDNGLAIFYTNAQLIFNDINVKIKVYVDSTFVGTLTKPLFPDEHPTCEMESGDNLIKVITARNISHYFYAQYETNNNIVECNGYFSIAQDSCTKVFIDFFNSKQL